jgi:hypothetical protein
LLEPRRTQGMTDESRGALSESDTQTMLRSGCRTNPHGTESFFEKLNYSAVRLEVLMAASVKMTVFWVVAPCSLVDVYRLHAARCLFIARMMEAVSTYETSVNSCKTSRLNNPEDVTQLVKVPAFYAAVFTGARRWSCVEPHEFSPHLPILFLRSILILSSHLRPRLPIGCSFQVFKQKFSGATQ